MTEEEIGKLLQNDNFARMLVGPIKRVMFNHLNNSSSTINRRIIDILDDLPDEQLVEIITKAKLDEGDKPDKIDKSDDKKPSGKGYEHWSELKDTADKGGHTVRNKIVMPIIGDTARLIGKAVGDENSILAQALQSVAQKRDADHARNPVMEGSSPFMTGMIAKKTYKGDMANAIGNTAANRIQQVADELEQRDEKYREAQYLVNERPNGDYYRNLANMRTNDLKQRMFGGKR